MQGTLCHGCTKETDIHDTQESVVIAMFCSSDVPIGAHVLVRNGRHLVPAKVMETNKETHMFSVQHYEISKMKAPDPNVIWYTLAVKEKEGHEILWEFEWKDAVLLLPVPKEHKVGKHRLYYQFAQGTDAKS